MNSSRSLTNACQKKKKNKGKMPNAKRQTPNAQSKLSLRSFPSIYQKKKKRKKKKRLLCYYKLFSCEF